MGLFDAFKTTPPALTPRLALAVGLLFMVGADGQVEQEEIGQLRSVVGGDQELIQTALKYLRSVKYEQFLTDAAALLNTEQKLCLLINMADSLLSDGRAELAEQQVFGKALAQFGFTEESFKGYFDTISLKNNRSIFELLGPIAPAGLLSVCRLSASTLRSPLPDKRLSSSR